jgi:hypothetical protein
VPILSLEFSSFNVPRRISRKTGVILKYKRFIFFLSLGGGGGNALWEKFGDLF